MPNQTTDEPYRATGLRQPGYATTAATSNSCPGFAAWSKPCQTRSGGCGCSVDCRHVDRSTTRGRNKATGWDCGALVRRGAMRLDPQIFRNGLLFQIVGQYRETIGAPKRNRRSTPGRCAAFAAADFWCQSGSQPPRRVRPSDAPRCRYRRAKLRCTVTSSNAVGIDTPRCRDCSVLGGP